MQLREDYFLSQGAPVGQFLSLLTFLWLESEIRYILSERWVMGRKYRSKCIDVW